MKKWLEKMAYKTAQWMYGRYGNDELTMVLLVTSIVLMLFSWIPYYVGTVLTLLSFATIIFSFYRTFSKKLDKRRRELARYQKLVAPFKNAWKLHKNKKRDKNTHVYFKCPSCRAVLRVPRGKGSIIVTCPRCSQRTEKKT